MAKPRPPLPDSDDPFVVLGVPPTAREKDVRKASLRLLKIYRPRKAPAEFDRVNAATQRALWLVEVRDREQRSGVKSVATQLLPAGSLEPSAEGPVASAEERDAWFRDLAVLIAREPDAALAKITAPAVLADAARDPDWALAVLRALGALAWRIAGVGDVRARIRLASNEAVAELSTRVAADLDASRAYHAWHRPILLPGFIEVVADSRLVDDEQRRANVALFREQVRVDARETLDHFDTIAARCPELVEPLARRLLEEVPAELRELRDAPPPLTAAIETRLQAVSRRAAVAGALAAGAAATLLAGISAVGGGAAGAGGLGGPAFWGIYELEKRQYRKSVRGELARVLLDLGITRACARQWIDGNRRRVLRLARFTYHMRQDKALLLLGMAAAATAPATPSTVAP